MSQRFWSDLTRELSPYVPGEQPKHPSLLKLNTNESPYPPSDAVLAAVASVSHGWTVPANYRSVRELLRELGLPPFNRIAERDRGSQRENKL